METKKAVTIEDLKETHGSRAEEVYNKIANIGGFGAVGNFHGGKPALDINGCSPQALSEIEKLLAETDDSGLDQSDGNAGDGKDDPEDKSDPAAATETKKKEGKK